MTKPRRSLESRGKSTNFVEPGGDKTFVDDLFDLASTIATVPSAFIMDIARRSFNGTDDTNASADLNVFTNPAQDTYLTPKKLQRQFFLSNGYIDGQKGDYGLVKKAVGDRKIPVYQKAPDAISRNKLIPLGNIDSMWYGSDDTALEHPGSYPTAVYTDGQGNFYQKAWDLNDYGGEGGSTSGLLGKVADFIGNPTVVTTGYQPMLRNRFPGVDIELTPMMKKKGLVPTEIDNITVFTLPEVDIIGRKKQRDGGSIHVKPSKRGTFTAAATKHGMGVQEFASRVLRNKEDYSPSLVKKANFARNASKWNR